MLLLTACLSLLERLFRVTGFYCYYVPTHMFQPNK